MVHNSEVARLRFIFTTVLLTVLIIFSAVNIALTLQQTTPQVAEVEVDFSSIESQLSTIDSSISALETKVSQLEAAPGAPVEPTPTVSLSAEKTYSINYAPHALVYHGNYVYVELNTSVLNRYSFEKFIEGKVGSFSSAYELGYVGGDFMVRLGYVYVNKDQKLYQYTWENFLADASYVGDPYDLSYVIDSMFYKDEYAYLTRDNGKVIYKYDWSGFLSNGNPVASYDLGFAPDAMFYYNGYVYIAKDETIYKYSWGDFSDVF
jgi:hypothetical protein